MKKKPKMSVIMPFYNAEKFLDYSITSILNQTLKEFEFIIINDASTDNSDIIVRKYLGDQRIIYIKNKKNQGIVYNLNRGLKRAQADIIARMDGDDISEPNRFEIQYRYLITHRDIALVGSYFYTIDEAGSVLTKEIKPIGSDNIKKHCFFYAPCVHPSIMFRKEIILLVGGYRQKWRYAEDVDLYFRVIYSGYKIDNVSQYLFKYRVYQSNDSSKHSKECEIKSFELKKEIIKKFNLNLGLTGIFLIYFSHYIGRLLSKGQKKLVYSLAKKVIK